MIIASMCTVPERKDDFNQVLRRILHEQTCPIHCLHVWLNGYATIPADLPQSPRIEYHLQPDNPGPWVRYTVADRLADDDVFITLDDDLEYPVDYVERGVRELLECGPRSAICFSGVCWDFLVRQFNYGQDRWIYLAEDGLSRRAPVALSMGQTSFFFAGSVRHGVTLSLPGFRTNDDLMIGLHLQRSETRILCSPKPWGWIKELSSARAEHALFRRDTAARHGTFRQMVEDMGFDPTAGRLAEFLGEPERILVTGETCPPLAGSERIDARLRPLCRENTGIHLVAPVPASLASQVQRYVDIPYRIHAVTVPEPGGRLDSIEAVRAWRNYRVNMTRRRLWRARVDAALRKLRPTVMYGWNRERGEFVTLPEIAH